MFHCMGSFSASLTCFELNGFQQLQSQTILNKSRHISPDSQNYASNETEAIPFLLSDSFRDALWNQWSWDKRPFFSNTHKNRDFAQVRQGSSSGRVTQTNFLHTFCVSVYILWLFRDHILIAVAFFPTKKFFQSDTIPLSQLPHNAENLREVQGISCPSSWIHL